jgi:hypothetical protein
MKKKTIIVLAAILIISGIIIRMITPPGTELIGFLTGAMFGAGTGLLIVQLLGEKKS